MSMNKHFIPILARRQESHLNVCVSLNNLDKAYIEYTAIGPRNGIKRNYVDLDYNSAVWLHRMLGKILGAEVSGDVNNE